MVRCALSSSTVFRHCLSRTVSVISPPQYLQQLCDAGVPLGLIDVGGEHVPDGAPDERAVAHELPVDAVEHRLQVLPAGWGGEEERMVL